MIKWDDTKVSSQRLSKNKVIANQPEGWCGDLPVFAGNPGFLTKKCCFLWGLPRHCARRRVQSATAEGGSWRVVV